MVETSVLSELAKVAKTLNSKSDSINTSIHAINANLADMNLGLKYWLEQPISDTGRQTSGRETYQDISYLGYDKLEEKWQLCLKQEHTVFYWDEDAESERGDTEIEYTPLLKASRNLRLDAIEHLDDLIEAITANAKNRLAAIARAEKLAKLS